MSAEAADLLPPRILVVDDERQIHASVRLRLARHYDLAFCANARDALRTLADNRYDLCLADIHMPSMDGLAFIEAAARVDRDLGFVILSAFDSDENLRRAIPLQVYEFLGKPLPEKNGFEGRIPGWIERTRLRRREHALADQAGVIARDLELARLEREVELVASESARDALLQNAGLLTTIQAHLAAAVMYLAPRVKFDPTAAQLFRGLDEARKTAEAATSVTGAFFDSGYGNRDTSPALVDAGVRHAMSIATRKAGASEANKVLDYLATDDRVPIRGLSGIEFLLMMVPAIELALLIGAVNQTIRVSSAPVARLDAAVTGNRGSHLLWLNRRNAVGSHPGVAITIENGGPALARERAESWLRGDEPSLAAIPARGLIHGIQRCHGLVALAVLPESERFRVMFFLPT